MPDCFNIKILENKLFLTHFLFLEGVKLFIKVLLWSEKLSVFHHQFCYFCNNGFFSHNESECCKGLFMFLIRDQSSSGSGLFFIILKYRYLYNVFGSMFNVFKSLHKLFRFQEFFYYFKRLLPWATSHIILYNKWSPRAGFEPVSQQVWVTLQVA